MHNESAMYNMLQGTMISAFWPGVRTARALTRAPGRTDMAKIHVKVVTGEEFTISQAFFWCSRANGSKASPGSNERLAHKDGNGDL